MHEHDCADACRLVAELVALDAAHWQSWAMRGKVLLACGQPEAAISDLRHALQMEPNDAEVKANLGHAIELAAQGKAPAAAPVPTAPHR